MHEWEDIVNRVAKSVLGEKTIVCGKSARWWGNEIKDKINHRHEVYKKIRRLSAVGKSCGMSIVDYVRKSQGSSDGEEA